MFENGFNGTATRVGYTGREHDAETGLLYYRARWYDQGQARFISEDPLGFAGGDNWYGYVGNNALNQIDPLGLKAMPRPDWRPPQLPRGPGGKVIPFPDRHMKGAWQIVFGLAAIIGWAAWDAIAPGTDDEYWYEQRPLPPSQANPEGTKPRPRKGLCSSDTSRAEAFQNAKNDFGIPPDQGGRMSTVRDQNYWWIHLPVWEFEDTTGRTVVIREDIFTVYNPKDWKKGGQCPHFNAGYKDDNKLKEHYYYDPDK